METGTNFSPILCLLDDRSHHLSVLAGTTLHLPPTAYLHLLCVSGYEVFDQQVARALPGCRASEYLMGSGS